MTTKGWDAIIICMMILAILTVVGYNKYKEKDTMSQLNNETGLVLVEKYSEQDGKSQWTTASMSEIHRGEIFRIGGRRGRVFIALADATLGPLMPDVYQVATEEIVFEN